MNKMGEMNMGDILMRKKVNFGKYGQYEAVLKQVDKKNHSTTIQAFIHKNNN